MRARWVKDDRIQLLKDVSGRSKDRFLESTTQTENKVKGRLLLDVIVSKYTPIFQLLPAKISLCSPGGIPSCLVEKMEDYAQGRVWTGNDAASRGLVDAIGGLSRAISIAKQKANIPQDK
ncbi:serine protease SPPA, chloroplastic [Tanacetum coccineum]